MSWMVQTKIPLSYKFIISTISKIPVSDLKPGSSFFAEKGQKFTHMGREKKNAVRYNMDEHRITAPF